MKAKTVALDAIAPTLSNSMHYIPGRAGTRKDAQRELDALRSLVFTVLDEGHTGQWYKKCSLCRAIRIVDKARKSK